MQQTLCDSQLVLVFISALWLCNSCRIGVVLQYILGGARAVCLPITWTTCLKRLRTPVLNVAHDTERSVWTIRDVYKYLILSPNFPNAIYLVSNPRRALSELGIYIVNLQRLWGLLTSTVHKKFVYHLACWCVEGLTKLSTIVFMHLVRSSSFVTVALAKPCYFGHYTNVVSVLVMSNLWYSISVFSNF